MNLVVSLFGLPGSGKSTLARNLSEVAPFKVVSAGKSLRKIVNQNAEGSDAIIGRSIMQQGLPIPVLLARRLLIEELETLQNKHPILDGYPRDFDQLNDIEFVVSPISPYRITGIYLAAPQKLIYQRLKNRVVCNNCGFSGSNTYGSVCPKCNGLLIKRNDDISISAVQSRILWFEKNVLPVIDLFASRYDLITIDANSPQESLLRESLKWLQNFRIL